VKAAAKLSVANLEDLGRLQSGFQGWRSTQTGVLLWQVYYSGGCFQSAVSWPGSTTQMKALAAYLLQTSDTLPDVTKVPSSCSGIEGESSSPITGSNLRRFDLHNKNAVMVTRKKLNSIQEKLNSARAQWSIENPWQAQ